MDVIGVLDWEMATIGDPLMDLGNSLAYWVQADDDFVARQTRRQPTHLRRNVYSQRSCGVLLRQNEFSRRGLYLL
jgi:aminoglycoside phosphotransferase (APT) family kinase protein